MAPGHFFFKDRLYLIKETYGSIPGGYLEKIVITTTLMHMYIGEASAGSFTTYPK